MDNIVQKLKSRSLMIGTSAIDSLYMQEAAKTIEALQTKVTKLVKALEMACDEGCQGECGAECWKRYYIQQAQERTL